MTTNQTAIESLRTFARSHNELAFAHLCTAALEGEEWAVERLSDTIRRVDSGAEYHDADQWLVKLAAIRATNTTRPDGAIARGLVSP